MKWIGLNTSKFVQGTVKADEIYFPREGACQGKFFHPHTPIIIPIFVILKDTLQSC